MNPPEHPPPAAPDPLGLRSLLETAMKAPSGPPKPEAKGEAKPSPLHQLLLRVVKEDSFLKPILDAGGLTFDRIAEGDTALPAGTKFPDALRVTYKDETRSLGLAIEVQLDPDPDKTFSWDEYLARVRSQLRCPSFLLVFCVDDKTERWAQRTLSEMPRVSPGVVIRAEKVAQLGPAAELGARILGAMESKQDPRIDPAPRLLALKAAYEQAPRGDPLAVMCYDVFALCFEAKIFKELGLMENGKKHFLDEMYADRYQNDIRVATEEGKQEGREEGKQEGMRASIRAMLAGRGFTLGPEHTAQVDAADEATLLAWMTRAGSAQTISEVFEPSVA